VSPPNLLFLFTDEQRADTMAAYGNTCIETPNLNRLAEESVVFDRAYVTQPVCTPSRSSIMTGLYPHSNGCTENNARMPLDMPCLPELLSDSTDGTYVTGYHGKWHLGDEIFGQHGFDDWVSIDDGYHRYYRPGRDPEARSSYHHFLVENGFQPADGRRFGRHQAARLPEAFSKPAYLAREASRFIRENCDRPFALYVNFFEPHMPFFGPRDGQYDPDEIPLPASFEAPPSEDQPLKTRLFERVHVARGNHGVPLVDEADWRRVIANYWGLCSLVDTYVGTILRTLEECGLWENTIIVYTSDHGDMMGSHHLLAKCVMFEEAVRVPLLVRLPGARRSAGTPRCVRTLRRVQAPTSQIDLLPTLLDLMGQPIPDHLQGQSLRPLLEGRGDATSGPPEAVIEWNGGNNGFGDRLGEVSIHEAMEDLASRDEIVRATTDPVRGIVTAEGWKFNCSPLGEHELYDLRQDPYELRNLAARPESRPRMRELLHRIRRWQERTGDTVELSI
jgi:arylsulfatase A-like enzyme